MLKIREWSRRYLFAEIVTLTVEILVAHGVRYFLPGRLVVPGFLAGWTGSLVYYPLMAYRDLKMRRVRDHGITLFGVLKVARNMAVEFGPAEYLDSPIIRPLALSAFPLIIPNYTLAIVVGSIVASVIAYTIVICSYETRKKVFKD